MSLTLNAGNGTLILSGSDDYSGGTNVAAGTLVVTSVHGLPPGGSLSIGDGAASLFGSPLQAGSLAGSHGNLPADSGRRAGRSGAEYAGPLVGGRVRPDGGEEGERAKS